MTLQETIIAQLGVKPSIDPKEEIRKSVDFLKAYMLKHPFLKTYVLGNLRRSRFYIGWSSGTTCD